MRPQHATRIKDLHAAIDALARGGLSGERGRIWLRSRNGALRHQRPMDVIGVSPSDVLHAAAEFSNGVTRLEPEEAVPATETIWTDAVIGVDGRPLVSSDANYKKIELAVRGISDELMRRLAVNPTLMRQLHWQDFERLVAELFERDGFEITPTPSRGDKGVDLFAARRTGLGTLLYVVECKQHSKPIGPQFVRELSWVIDRHRATGGVLATTSRFTPGAMTEQEEMRFRMTLADFEMLRKWLRGGPIFN